MSYDIIQTLNDNLPLIQAVGGSALTLSMWKSVEGAIRVLFEPCVRLRNGKAELELERERGSAGIITRYEAVKLQNFLKVAGFATDELDSNSEANETVTDETPEFDWIMRFFDAVSLISNEDLQKLWGKIMAGETRKPGSCSLKTLDIVRNLSKKEAESFSKICSLVLKSGNMAFVFGDGFVSDNFNNERGKIISQYKLNYLDDIQPLIEAGLITIDHYFIAQFEGNNTVAIHNSKLLGIVKATENSEPLKLEPYILTKSGMELYEVISQGYGFEEDEKYQISCFKELKRTFVRKEVTLFRVQGKDELEEIDL